MTVKEIIEAHIADGGDPKLTIVAVVWNYLELHECDGLAGHDECGCGKDDLFPCGYLSGDCRAGHRDGNVYRPGRKEEVDAE